MIVTPLAAAIKAKAEIILTFNLKYFPDNALQPYGIKAVTPDILLAALFDDNSDYFGPAFQRQLTSLKNPPKIAEELLERLSNQKISQTIAKLKDKVFQ